ncbi:hypothetical protein [Bradyrhizobium phage BDU-MI-1]|nr:hypothetical protein [Bradyrhizobium phage BDU-MI-1]
MTEQQSRTFVKHLPPEEVGEELAGWWIISVDVMPDGSEQSYDAVGPYDSKAEAERLADPQPRPCPQEATDWCVWPNCSCKKEAVDQ